MRSERAGVGLALFSGQGYAGLGLGCGGDDEYTVLGVLGHRQ